MTFKSGQGRGDRYGTPHRKARAAALTVTTSSTPCARCGRPLGPEHALDKRGRKIGLWHYDHDERGGYLGFSHRTCNQNAGARKGRAMRDRITTRPFTRPTW